MAFRDWPQRWCVLPLALLALLTIFPLFSTGFTTNDDMLRALSPLWDPMGAIIQGRIGFFLIGPATKVPYLINNAVYYNLVRFGAPLVLLGVIFVLVGRASRSFAVSVLFVTFFLAFYQNNWNHNAITSYPFEISLLALFVVLALGSYSRYLRSGGVYGALAAALCFLSMSAEMFVPFFVVFAGVAILHEVEASADEAAARSIRAKTLAVCRDLWPIAVSTALYLVLYVGWRQIHPSSYEGNTASLGSVTATLRTIVTFSVSAAPGFEALYHRLSPQAVSLVTSYGVPRYGLRTLLANMRVEWLVKAALAAWLVWVALRDRGITAVPRTRLRFGLAIAFICIFLPNVGLGLSEKYRQWAAAGVTSFVYTYYSVIAVMLFLALVAVWLIKGSAFRPRLRLALIAGAVALTAALSITTDFNNYAVATDEQLSHLEWTVVDRFAATPYFASMPQGSVLYAPSLLDFRGIAQTLGGAYWTRYLRQKTGKQVTVATSQSELPAAASAGRWFYLEFNQEPHSGDQYLVFAPIVHPAAVRATGLVSAPAATILSYSTNKVATLLGFTADKKAAEYNVWVDGQPVAQTMPGAFASVLDWRSQPTSMPASRITSSTDLDVNSFILSYYAVTPTLSPYSFSLGPGFYITETAPGQSDWTWSSGNASLNLINAGAAPAPAALHMTLSTLLARHVAVSVGSIAKVVKLGPDGAQDVTLRLLLRPGMTTVRLSTDVPAAVPASGTDSRKLTFRIFNVGLSEPLKR